MKTIYFETIDSSSAGIYKIYNVIILLLALSFMERELTIETNTLLSNIQPNW